MSEKLSLNASCPFGEHTTRFYSNLGEAPNIIESREANLQIMKVLNKLAEEIKKRNPDWVPVSVSEYEKMATVSHRLVEHSPASLGEIFPVSEDRTVEFIFKNKIQSHDTVLASALCTGFLDEENNQGTKKSTAQYILGLLQKRFTDFVASDGKELDLANTVIKHEAVKQGEGIIISEEDFEMLKEFQNLQERFEDTENIQQLNALPQIQEIIEILLGIQLSICDTLEELRREDPKWFNDNSIAFLEIATVDENNEIVPSSRLLKLILHNVGEYLIKTDLNVSPEAALVTALQEALKHSVFHQKISIFTKTDNGIRFDGVADKICPARTALSQIIMNQLTNRMLKQ